MAKICLCLTAKTLGRNLEILDKYRKYTDMAELRVDCLNPDERLLIRRFPELAGLPVILTIRRIIDGGFFSGGEGARVTLMARGLAYADANRRLNFAYVDIEDDLNVPSLEEAARTFGTRIIRSWHSFDGKTADIPAKIRGMKCIGDDLVKIAVKVNATSDVLRMLRAAREYQRKEKIFVCMGQLGAYSRILAEQFGSYLSFAGAPDLVKGAAGQIDVEELAELYRFRSIGKSTKIYGVMGNHPLAPEGIRFFNAVFKQEDMDAVYAPFPVDSAADFMELADELNISGLSISGSYKEELIPFLIEPSSAVVSSGMCNTIFKSGEGWAGSNTEAQGFTDSVLEFTGRKNLRRAKISIIGAGGMAKLIAAELYRQEARVLILNRSAPKAREIAGRYKFAWSALDSKGIEMINKYRDIIIQATPLGMEGRDSGDPLEMYGFSGREAVMDLVWKPERSRFLTRAAEAGCRVINGLDMLNRQARYQYEQFTGNDFPPQLAARIQFGRS